MLMSGYSESDLNVKALGTHFAFLSKPFSRRELGRGLRELLDASPL
jgi:hypothetical protein